MAYPRYCKYCSQPIIMSPLGSGRWQPWEPDGSSRHKCGSGVSRSTVFPLKKSNSETRPSPCPWCQKPVYYHTNGYGDSVYFEVLGVPWQVHPCWEQYWKTKSTGQKAIEQQRKMLRQEEWKHRELIAAFRKVANSRAKYKNCTYAESLELNIAKILHLNLKQLRQEYGHLYALEADGIRFLGLLNNSKQSSEETAWASEVLTSPQVEGKETSKLEMVACPRCRTKVRKNRLQRHLQKVHRIGISTASISPEIRPLRSQVGCPYCSNVVSEQFLEKHIHLNHRNRGEIDKALGIRAKPLAICPYCMAAVRKFKRHLNKKHPEKLEGTTKK